MGTRLEIEQAFNKALATLKALSPEDTGNLRYNAIKGEWRDDKTFHIYVDEEIAPYMVYTNEPWKSLYWGGKKNPNEHWWNDSADLIIKMIAYEMGNVLKDSEGGVL